MKNFSINESFSKGWKLLLNNPILIALFFFATLPHVASHVISKIFIPQLKHNSDYGYTSIGIILGLFALCFVLYIVGQVLEAASYNGSLKAVKGEKAELNSYSLSLGTYVKFVITNILAGILICIGFVICIIPGIFLSVKLKFVSFALLDDPECSIGEAFSRSWNMTSGHFWGLFGLDIVSIIVIIIGILCCGVGVLFAAPLISLVFADVYMTLKDEEQF